MSWDKLPIELHIMILSFRNEIRNNASLTIQRSWGKYMAPSIAALDIILEMEVDQNGTILATWKPNVKILEYCTRVLSGHINKSFWNVILEGIYEGLIADEVWVTEANYNDTPNLKYYYYTEHLYYELLNKFNKFS